MSTLGIVVDEMGNNKSRRKQDQSNVDYQMRGKERTHLSPPLPLSPFPPPPHPLSRSPSLPLSFSPSLPLSLSPLSLFPSPPLSLLLPPPLSSSLSRSLSLSPSLSVFLLLSASPLPPYLFLPPPLARPNMGGCPPSQLMRRALNIPWAAWEPTYQTMATPQVLTGSRFAHVPGSSTWPLGKT